MFCISCRREFVGFLSYLLGVGFFFQLEEFLTYFLIEKLVLYLLFFTFLLNSKVGIVSGICTPFNKLHC
jgi:hypothetical protein